MIVRRIIKKMFNISKDGIIRLSRGDSCKMPLFINKGNELEPIRYELSKNPQTVVYLSIMQPNQYFENGCIRKMYTKDNWQLNDFGDLIVSLEPKDTIYLVPGKYYYEIKVDLEGLNQVNTIIQKTEFWVM